MATADFLTKVGAHAYKPQCWIEIEGIRRRYGTTSPSWAPTADTGTNRIIRPWFEGPPKVSGQSCKPLDGETSPSRASCIIGDFNEELTDLFSEHDESDGFTYLAAAVDAGDGTIDVDDSSSFSANSDIYVNRETMRLTVINVGIGVGGSDRLTVLRGQYGSEDSDHTLEDAQGNSREVKVLNKPPMILTRGAEVKLGIDGLLEADAITLVKGFIKDVSEDRQGVWRLEVSGLLERLSVQIGETLATAKLSVPLWGGEIKLGKLSPPFDVPAVTFTSMCILLLDDGTGDNFQSSGWVLIDEEMIEYTHKEDYCLKFEDDDIADLIKNRSFFTATRGMMGEHIPGHNLKPMDDGTGRLHFWPAPMFMTWHDQDVEVKQVISWKDFDNAESDGISPIDAILEFLCSYDGDGTNGTYDTLPKGWGAAIDEDLVDVAGIELLKPYFADRIQFAITEPEDLKKWLAENILRPCMLFPVETDEGKIGFKRLLTKAEAEIESSVQTIDHSVFMEPPVINIGSPPMGDFQIEVNYYPPQDKFYSKLQVILGDASERYGKVAEKFEAEIKTIHDIRLGRGGRTWLSDDRSGMPSILGQLLGTIWDRFGQHPCPKFSPEIPLSYYVKAKAGAVVQLTSTVTPDVQSSARGLTTVYCQVIEEGIDLERGTFTPLLWMIGVHDADYRKIAPSGKVKSYAASGPLGDPRIVLEPSYFTDGETYTYDVDAFSVGDKVQLVSGASGAYYHPLGFAPPETVEIKALNSGAGANDCWIDLTAVPTTAPSAGDFVETATYDNCVAAQKAAWSFLADVNETLGAASDDAHRRI